MVNSIGLSNIIGRRWGRERGNGTYRFLVWETMKLGETIGDK